MWMLPFAFDASTQKIYDYCVSVLLCLRQYPPLLCSRPIDPAHTESHSPHLPFLFLRLSNFYFLYVRKMSNLLPLKSIASKGIESRSETKIEAYFVYDIPTSNTLQSASTWDGKELSGWKESFSSRNIRAVTSRAVGCFLYVDIAPFFPSLKS